MASVGEIIQIVYNSVTGRLKVETTSATGGGATGTRTSVNDAATNQVLKVANANRMEIKVFNDSTATLYLAEGDTDATTTDYTVKLGPGEFYVTSFRGEINGIWSSDASGAARITETT